MFITFFYWDWQAGGICVFCMKTFTSGKKIYGFATRRFLEQLLQYVIPVCAFDQTTVDQ
jgi:hypothetical protein